MAFAVDEVADRLACALFELGGSVGLPTSLKAAGVPRDALATLADATLFDGSLVYNPRTVAEATDILPVWEAAWEGVR